MKSRSETHEAPNGARVEVGTIILEGREFAALGSIVDVDAGIIVGYPCLADGRFELRTWNGEPIMPLRKVRTYRGGFYGSEIVAWSGEHGGRRYSGRNGGTNMVVTMRAGRTAGR